MKRCSTCVREHDETTKRCVRCKAVVRAARDRRKEADPEAYYRAQRGSVGRRDGADPERFQARREEIPKRWRANNPLKILLSATQRRASRCGLPFDIALADLILPATCPVLGRPFERGDASHHEWSPSLDRIIPELGYVRGNVRVISWRANRLKSDGTATELRAVAEYIERSCA